MFIIHLTDEGTFAFFQLMLHDLMNTVITQAKLTWSNKNNSRINKIISCITLVHQVLSI